MWVYFLYYYVQYSMKPIILFTHTIYYFIFYESINYLIRNKTLIVIFVNACAYIPNVVLPILGEEGIRLCLMALRDTSLDDPCQK